jgi:hypothetical protein
MSEPRNYSDNPPSILEKIEYFFKASLDLENENSEESVGRSNFFLNEAYGLVETYLSGKVEEFGCSNHEFCNSILKGKTKYVPDWDEELIALQKGRKQINLSVTEVDGYDVSHLDLTIENPAYVYANGWVIEIRDDNDEYYLLIDRSEYKYPDLEEIELVYCKWAYKTKIC